MTALIQKKIDRVLDNIKDAQTGLSIAQLGVVGKVRHSEQHRKIIVFLNRLGNSKACCAALNMFMLADFEIAIKDGLKVEFPEFSVEIADM